MNAPRFKKTPALAALLLGVAFASQVHAAFVYETPNEFFSAGDFNGDGIADVLILDKATGNARVGYSDGNGGLTWSAPLVTGVENVTGLGVEHFLSTTNDSVAVTAPNANHVNLVDLSQTNSAGTPNSVTPLGIGPHAVTGLASPQMPNSGGLPFLLVASSFNNAPAEQLDFLQWFGAPLYYGLFNESNSFERLNELNLSTNTATFAVGLARGTNDALHLWQFTNSPAVLLAFSNLPSGSDYVFGNFNGEPSPRFIFYQSGGTNLTIVPLMQTNSGLAFGPVLSIALTQAVQEVFYLQIGTNGSALIQFGDGVQGLSLPDGLPVFSAKYQTGAGAVGNIFTGIVPLPNGQFALFDAPPGSLASAHAQVIRFDGTNFTQRSSSTLPLVSSPTSRANVWLFQLEPFVNRSPGFVASLNSPVWADGVNGLPGAVQVPTESDAGATNGLGNVSTNNLGAPPGGSAYGIANQYNPAISLFSYSAPRAADPITVNVSPPPGSYGSPLMIAFNASPANAGVRYRVRDADSWHSYAAPFSITNDMTIEFFGTNIFGVRSSLQFATYTLGVSGAAPPSPVNPNPGNTNPPPVLATNAVVLSQNGTVFYGRVSAANNYTIWAINLDGSGDTFITTGARPRVSRDGRNVAFLRGGSPLVTQGNVWVRNLQTGQESLLYTNSSYTLGYDWDLTGTNLVFDWSCWLWRESLGGTASGLPLPAPDCYDDAPVVNPVDGRLAFHNLNSSAAISGLYVTTPDLASKQRLNLGVTASWPAWSPDGQWLVFADGNSSASAFTADNGTNLWVVRSDGTSLNQITGFSDGTNRFPHGAIWGPDGDDLVGAGTVFGTNGLWIIPLTPALDDCDGPPIRLPTTSGDAIDFAGSIVVAASPSSLVTTTQAPGLFIRQTPEAVVVYWSTNFVGFALESETNLWSPAWTPINGPYFLSGLYFEHWEARGSLSSQKYFRLHSPGVFVLSQPPVLTIQLQTNTAVLSWSALPAGFTLQSKTDLSTAVPWNDLTGPYTINGGNYEYREPAAPTQRRFFRLRGP